MLAKRFRTPFSIVILAVVITSFFSCASRYRSVRPESIRYNEPQVNNSLEFGYKYSILGQSGNKKYARREGKKGIDLVAIKFTNNTANSITLRDDIQIMAGGNGVFPIDREIIKKELKQGLPIYLLYSLLVINTSECTNGNCDVSTYPVGVGIAGFNMIVAGIANKNFADELERYDLLDRVIAPGETVYGLIGLQAMGYAPLTLRLKKSVAM
jgi:hypothetical protein